MKSPLKYFPIVVGDYSLHFDKYRNSFDLMEKNQRWLTYNQTKADKSCEFHVEMERAKGVCITTGLGLGILQAHLCLNQDVTKVIVYEKSPNVIEIFHRIVEFNEFDISKIEIRNEDANNIANQSCDCLFPDHFELESEEYIIDIVKRLSENNQADLVWYWPGAHHYISFAIRKELSITNDTYELWKNYTGIKNLPNTFNDSTILYLKEYKEDYQKILAPIMKTKSDMLEQRNNLLKLKDKIC